MSRTYLQECLKDDVLCRWPDSAMPIHVYVAPFTWYEKKKQQESLFYRQMVLDAFAAWRAVSNGLVRFNFVDKIELSQIDVKWRRINRKSLGHCTYEIDNLNRLFTAEIQIGISDGLIHAEYQDAGEVRHTILHEIGHALGLSGHSDNAGDIMYVPHQYGIHTLSPRDIETLQWLYRLPVGFQFRSVGEKYNLKGHFTMNQVIDKIEQRIHGVEPQPDAALPEPPRPDVAASPASQNKIVSGEAALSQHHEILSQMGRFYLKTQHVQIDPQKQAALRKMMIEKNYNKGELPPSGPT